MSPAQATIPRPLEVPSAVIAAPVGASPPPRPAILFTAFEPSGDDHASAVIAELRRRHAADALPIYCWGGPKMERAGATLVERTGDNAVMGLPGPGKIIEHLRINKRIRRWLEANSVAVHVPVDSPGANFPVCKITKAAGAKVVHLAAPQLWAWAPWRIKKLRRCTDLLLCLLPFEEDWFLARGVRARFVGHPLFDAPLDLDALEKRAAKLGPGNPKVALMPGSRPKEIRAAWPVLLDAFRRLRADFPNTAGVVAATRPEVADGMRTAAARYGGWPEGLTMVSGDADAVVRWCDFALVTSGTVTLQVARQQKPMITFYRVSRLMYWLLVRWLTSTEIYSLPNLIAGKRIIPELIPYFGNGDELALGIIRLMRQPGYADDQRAELTRIATLFDGRNAAVAAADAIEEMAGLRKR